VAAGLALLWMSMPALAGKPIYHCTKDGQTVLTDQPCDGAAPAPVGHGSEPGTSVAGSAQAVVGTWAGQAQYQGTESGQRIDAAQSLTPLTLSLTADGKVAGASPDNGCEWSGEWTAGSSPTRFSLELSASGCRYPSFDRRYTGNLSVTWADQSAQFGLQAFDQAHAGQGARMYDIRATLKVDRGAKTDR
jgi:hypothetical protein